MEYASFVKDLRRESYNSTASPPDTQYAKEFEEQMQALVINFDVDDPYLEQQHQYSITSTPLQSGSGLKWKTQRKAICTTIFDETEQVEVPKKKKALEIVQNSSEDLEFQRSFDSSEGISLRFDSSSSSDDIPDLMACNELIADPSSSHSTYAGEDHVQRRAYTSFPFEAIQGEDSLLEPSADISPNDRTKFPTKCLCTPAKRTYDEANS
ncbi:uncharacterized protein LOC128715237 [Anopheles marshallii]|uniref:uncharacterized protein LOC128715237 n=1 Tax=Anopheles marshallii TaxID=1521116 RepID=UPI00237C16BE|nr:uncharacterized protein LOC128715237 [Anopheles marshallii]